MTVKVMPGSLSFLSTGAGRAHVPHPRGGVGAHSTVCSQCQLLPELSHLSADQVFGIDAKSVKYEQ